MNKNKSHLYALMIHQANSSWLKSLRGILGQNTALMPQCGKVLKEPFSMALIQLILWAKDRLLTWKSKHSTFTNSVFNGLVLVVWELTQAFLCTYTNTGTHSMLPGEAQHDKSRLRVRKCQERSKPLSTQHPTTPWDRRSLTVSRCL